MAFCVEFTLQFSTTQTLLFFTQYNCDSFYLPKHFHKVFSRIITVEPQDSSKLERQPKGERRNQTQNEARLAVVVLEVIT